MFLGGEGIVDDIPSLQWINMQLGDLDMRYEIISNAPHSRALEVIQSEGSLIAFCSLQENVCGFVCLFWFVGHLFSVCSLQSSLCICVFKISSLFLVLSFDYIQVFYVLNYVDCLVLLSYRLFLRRRHPMR